MPSSPDVTRIFVVSRASALDAPRVSMRLSHPPSILFVVGLAALDAGALTAVVASGWLSAAVAAAAALLLFCAGIAAAPRARLEFDLAGRSLRLPGGQSVAFSEIRGVRLETLPPDSDHDWANGSLTVHLGSGAIRLDLVVADLDPLEGFADRLAGAVGVSLEKASMLEEPASDPRTGRA
jgi:hypothetical protein